MVVRRDPTDEIGLGLVRDHLDDVGEVFALGGELDDVAGDNLADGDSPGHPGALGFELGVAAKRVPDRRSELGGRDLEAAHRGPLGFAVDGPTGDGVAFVSILR